MSAKSGRRDRVPPNVLLPVIRKRIDSIRGRLPWPITAANDGIADKQISASRTVDAAGGYERRSVRFISTATLKLSAYGITVNDVEAAIARRMLNRLAADRRADSSSAFARLDGSMRRRFSDIIIKNAVPFSVRIQI